MGSRILRASGLLFLLAALSAAAAPTVSIPLRRGLTVVSASTFAAGDGESISQVQKVSDSEILLRVSGQLDDGRKVQNTRRVRREDEKDSHRFRQIILVGELAHPEYYPGTVPCGSTAVLMELKTTGRTDIECQVPDLAGIATGVGNLLKSAGIGELLEETAGKELKELDAVSLMKGSLERAAAETLSVIVNDRRVDLPVVHAKGTLRTVAREEGLRNQEDVDFYFLDDAAHPMCLRYRIGEQSGEVVKISYPEEAPTRALEQRLIESGHVEIYGIYFDFGSATIRPESEPVLKEIAATLNAQRAWKLSIEGHTDSIGSDADNLRLSQQRADAVRDVLVSRYQVAAERLTTSGHGETRPIESNDSLAGRARNRRVELTRS